MIDDFNASDFCKEKFLGFLENPTINGIPLCGERLLDVALDLVIVGAQLFKQNGDVQGFFAAVGICKTICIVSFHLLLLLFLFKGQKCLFVQISYSHEIGLLSQMLPEVHHSCANVLQLMLIFLELNIVDLCICVCYSIPQSIDIGVQTHLGYDKVRFCVFEQTKQNEDHGIDELGFAVIIDLVIFVDQTCAQFFQNIWDF